MTHRLGVSGSTIYSNPELYSELFWDGVEHIEIGEFPDEKALNEFLGLCKEKQISFGIHILQKQIQVERLLMRGICG